MLKEKSAEVTSATSRELELRKKIAELHEQCNALASDKVALQRPEYGIWKARSAAIDAEIEALEAERADLVAKLAGAHPAAEDLPADVVSALEEAATRADTAEGYPDESLAVTWTQLEERYSERLSLLESAEAAESSLPPEIAALEAKSAQLSADVRSLETQLRSAETSVASPADAALRAKAEAAVSMLEMQLSKVTAENKRLEATLAEIRSRPFVSPGELAALKMENRRLSVLVETTKKERDEASAALLAFKSRPMGDMVAYGVRRDGLTALASSLTSFVSVTFAGVLASIVGGLKASIKAVGSPFRDGKSSPYAAKLKGSIEDPYRPAALRVSSSPSVVYEDPYRPRNLRVSSRVPIAK